MPRGRGSSASRFSYTDFIPGYDAGDNPLGDVPPESNPPQYEDPILPGGRPPMPPAQPPATVPIDPGLGGGDGSGSPSGVDPEDVPPADPPPEQVPIDPGLLEGIEQSQIADDTQESGGNGEQMGNDYALIGVISLLFFGGMILGLKR